eukprot:UN30202
MLVSPLMGPILAFTFGTWIRDWNLTVVGLVSELVGLLLCILTGFVMGLCYANWAEDPYKWPTEQMASRGQLRTLAEGFSVAFPSGIGVALSILGGNMAGLVGVAISASLLPPAVNTGLYFAFMVWYPDRDDIAQLTQEGFISLLLTIENITLIYITSLVVLWAKHFAPMSHSERQFWNSIEEANKTKIKEQQLKKEEQEKKEEEDIRRKETLRG